MNNVPSCIQESGSEVIEDFITRFPVFNTDLDTVIESVGENYKPIVKEPLQNNIPDGTIKFDSNTEKYHGYYGGRVVTKVSTSEKAKNQLATYYDVVEFFEGV